MLHTFHARSEDDLLRTVEFSSATAKAADGFDGASGALVIGHVRVLLRNDQNGETILSLLSAEQREGVLADLKTEGTLSVMLLAPRSNWTFKPEDDRVSHQPLKQVKTPKKPLLDSFDIAGVVKYIKEKNVKRIMVMCGAGISVAAGIPDFRSPKTGIYANLQKFNLPYPEAVFTLDYLNDHPEKFYEVANSMQLWPGLFPPTHAHHFVSLLHDNNLLLRCFTQNIDSLERQAGVPEEKIIEAHGSFAAAHCMNRKCKAEVPMSQVRAIAEKGEVPRCVKCSGVVKPDVVFFGENLPDSFFRGSRIDPRSAELLIIMGTSLTVYPFASLVEMVLDNIPRIIINNTRVGGDEFIVMQDFNGRNPIEGEQPPYRDVWLDGDLQEQVQKLADAMGFGNELAERYQRQKAKVEKGKTEHK